VRELVDIIQAWEWRRGESFALATLVRSRGSSYRRPGARMLICADGSTVGSLSGGCLEEEVAERAKEVTRSGAPTLMEFDTRRRFGCNGAIEIFVEAAREEFLADLADSFQQRRKRAAITVFEGQNTSGAAGTRMLHPGEAAPAGCFVQHIAPPIQLVIFGEGPDSAPLRSLAQILGWQVIESDRAENLPVKLDDRTAAIVKSHNYGRDFTALQRLLQLDLRYVGLLGPRKRRDQLLGDLLDVGVSINAELFSPAGLDLRAETPEEIALAIVSEIQAVFAESSVESLRDRKSPIHGWNVAPVRANECETSAR
jgi:xanthine/CO dehydrogenase XdhC/CoxF family maturation factor